MAKSKPKRKADSKRKNYTIMFLAVLLAIFLIFGFFLGKNIKENRKNQNPENSQENMSFYDEERCRCVERERLRCNDGFELDAGNRLCRNGTDITNVILACSKYECAGNIYVFNFENKTWEMAETKTGEG